MASIIDEFRTYLNTPKKIILFRFGISLTFFLLGLSMVNRVNSSRIFDEIFLYIDLLGWSVCVECDRSISRWISLVNYRCGRIILYFLGLW